MDLKIVGAMLRVAMMVVGDEDDGGANCSNTVYDSPTVAEAPVNYWDIHASVES